MTMHYEFPANITLDEVREVIKDDPNFIIVEKGSYTVVNYVRMGSDTFPPVIDRATAIRRELRGLIFDTVTGVILRRGLTKFFNIFENNETHLEKLDFSLPHKVYNKLDGSMISCFEMGKGSGVIRWGSKMGAGTDVAMEAECFVASHRKYQKFAEWCIQNDITPVFEYTSPGKHRIVVEYKEPMLTLIAARNMITGEYLSLVE